MKPPFALIAIVGLALFGCAESRPWERSLEPIALPTIAAPAPTECGRLPSVETPTDTGASAIAESPPSAVDLPTVLRLAGANDWEVAAARERIHAAYADTVQASERFIPKLDAGVSASFHRGVTQATEGEFVHVDKQNVFEGAGATLRWELGDAIFQRLAAEQRYRASVAALDRASLDSVRDAALAYFDLVEAQGNVRVEEEAVETSRVLFEQIEASVAVGSGFRGDALRARTQLERARLAEVKANDHLRGAAIRLATRLRLDPKVPLYAAEPELRPVAFADADRPVDDLLREALARRPDVVELESRVHALEQERTGIVWGPLVPSLQGTARTGGFGRTIDDSSNQQQYQVTLGWEIGPGGLFDFGRREAVDARLRAARIDAARQRDRIVAEVVSAHAEVASARAQMDRANAAVAQAADALRLFRERRESGVGLPLEVIDAEESLTQSKRDAVEAIVAFDRAQYRLRAATAQSSNANRSSND
ncbi:MAG: TolC family protein [Planctomycetes bacterium]|nr:TolC family protein [Planctomycetota bacterium]